MGFEPVRRASAPRDEPALSIYPGGAVRFNVTAVDRWLQDVEKIGVYVDTDEGQLGISRGESGPNAYRFTKNNSGKTAHLKTPLVKLGVDVEGLDDSATFTIEENPDEGLLIADVSDWEEVGHDE